MDRQTSNAVIYCRVSTKEQVEEGNSLVTQEKICREYATRFAFSIAKIFIELGESAKTANRTELQNMLKFCSVKKNAISTVIVYKIDRLSRNVDDYSNLRAMLRDYGVSICSTSEQFDNRPAGRFMENILANVAQFDNDVRTERSVNGMKEAVKSGRFIWPAPFGYINSKIDSKTNIVPHQEKAIIVRETFELVCSNKKSMEEVRRLMSTKGLTIGRTQFYNMLRNKIYYGIIEQFGESNVGAFEPIISKDTFDLVQRLFKSPGKKIIPYNTKNPDFPLRRFISHQSGKKLTGSWSKGRSGAKFPYYRFVIKGSNYRKEQFENAFCHFMNSFGFDRAYHAQLWEYLKSTLSSQNNAREQHKIALEARIFELKKRQTALIEKNLKGFISDELLKDQLDFTEREITDYSIQSHQIRELTIDKIEGLPEYMDEFLVTPGDTWKKIDHKSKLKLQVFEFPHGITFDGESFRTQFLSLVYKAKDTILSKMSNVVHHSVQNNNTPDTRILHPSLSQEEKEFINACLNFKTDMENKG